MIGNWLEYATDAAATPLLDADESVFDASLETEPGYNLAPWQEAVYECCDTALWGKHLVVTPYMLLDRLKVCADLANAAQDRDIPAEARSRSVARISEEINHLLHLLWRGGIWTDKKTEQKIASNGRNYRVLTDPFTLGKHQGKELPDDAPEWLQEVLGVHD